MKRWQQHSQTEQRSHMAQHSYTEQQNNRVHQFAQAKSFKLGFAVLLCLSLCVFALCGCGGSVSTWSNPLEKTTVEETQELDNTVNVNQLPDSTFLYDADISDLANADSFYDGQTVQIEGEVVGDRIKAEDGSEYCWISIQKQGVENPEVISVLMSDSQADLIDSYGSYSQTGTTLKVRGTFNLVCADHEGASDIHVSEATVMKKGSAVINEINPIILTAGIISIIGAVLLLIFYQYMREKEL